MQKQLTEEQTATMSWIRRLLLGIVLVAGGPYAEPLIAQEATLDQPNIVVILVDDLGWRDLSCYGSNYYETPNIDRLAKSGMRFTDAYAACSVCSPSRAALLTGRYPARLGVTDWIRARFQSPPYPTDGKNPSGLESVGQRFATPRNALWMENSEETLAEVLGANGYATCHLGKWHLGPPAQFPEQQGFDRNVGGCDFGQPPRYFFPYRLDGMGSLPALDQGKAGEYLTDRLADEAVQFLEENKKQRFFMHFAHYAVHTPIQGKAPLVAKYEKKPKAGQKNHTYAAMIESMDDAVGKVLDKLDALKLTEKTVVIFTSDNGGYSLVTNNAPLRGGKGNYYEGGIRVPLLIRWPGFVEEDSVSYEPVTGVDFFPTVLNIVGIEPNEDVIIDGESLVPLLVDGEPMKREAIYWHFPHYRGGDATPYGIVRAGNYKLIRRYEDSHVELYHLKDDLGEQENLAEKMPEKRKQLEVMLSKWLLGARARMPESDPNYKSK